MLYYLFAITYQWKTFNDVVRKLIILCELPLIRRIFLLAGATEAHPRNSIYESDKFNVFMSDLDFSIVSHQDQFSFLYQLSKGVRKIFPNFGEIEIYTTNEWAELMNLQSSNHWHFWNKIYLIRKLNWQRIKLSEAKSSYEKKKQSRSLEITLRRLNQKNFPLNGSRIFEDLTGDVQQDEIHFPYDSGFLENILYIGSSQEGIYFTDKVTADRLISILPENRVFPEDKVLKEIKLLITRKEYFLAKTSFRLKQMENPNINSERFINWLRDLEEKIRKLTE